MMNRKDALQIFERHGRVLRQLASMRRVDLATQLAARDRADGRTRLVGGPRTRDELIGELLDLNFPRAVLDEVNHVLYHEPGAPWSACEHCAGVTP